MSKHLFGLFVCTMIFLNFTVAQSKISGTVTTEKNVPLAGATITNKTQSKSTSTDQSGKFEIEANVNDVLSISYIGYSSLQFELKGLKDPLQIKLISSESIESVVVGGGSPKSFWLGATIGYNIDGANVDNVVGSAKMAINPIKKQYLKADWGIVGNFSNFISAQDKEKMTKDLLKLSQGSQGLSISIAGTREILPSNSNFNFRMYFLTGYRLNAFQKVGKDSISVGLSQFRNSFGLELEGLEFEKGGKIHFSIEGSLAFFDESKYNLIFSEKKKTMATLEASVILPIASNIGFLINGTYNKRFAPVYQVGIIFKDLK
jgi:hypothetical protein